MDPAPLTALITTSGIVLAGLLRWVVSPWMKQRSAIVRAMSRLIDAVEQTQRELIEVNKKLDGLKDYRAIPVYKAISPEEPG